GVGAAGAIMADVRLGKAAVVNRVVGLDRCNHVQLSKTLEVFGRHVLRVLDAQPTIGGAMRFDYLGIQVKDGGNTFVANGVSADLQSRGIGLYVAIPHERNRLHFIGQQTAIVALIQKRLVEISRSRTERAGGKGFEGADAEIWSAEGTADAEFRQVVNVSDGRSCIDSRGQFTTLQQFGVNGDVF